ncbi:MAG: glycosyl transferase family protein, partial [Bdellovibrionales bacterium]|nr:glycosyl transferase family protein [Ramlibacter sp.]
MNLSLLPGGYISALDMMAAVVVVIICISAADDLFIDLWYWTRRLYRAATAGPGHPALTAAQMHAKSEQPLAIMVPAWLEHDVVAAMIENMVEVLDYQNYHIFVGTYINDSKTTGQVERMCLRYRQVHRAAVPHDGPTSKADCLNAIVEAIQTYEQLHDTEFAGVVLHGSEDVLHPLELKFFNYLLPRKDLIQLPVTSLERQWHELVAGTYMDEFAESHARDMALRESVAGVVPSAGTGTCFSRRALKTLVGATHGRPFNANSLSEDYDTGTRLAKLGMHSIFGVFPVAFRIERRAWTGGSATRELTVSMPLCVRQFFPDTFRLAYRGKARLILGNCMQSWQQVRWKGSLAARYLMLHDSKSTITALVNVLACVLAAQYLLIYIAQNAGLWPKGTAASSLFAANSGWRALLWFIAVSLVIRCAHRVYFTTTLYGWEHGLIAVPRMVVSNFVNFMAVARAWRLLIAWLFRNKPLAWVKTAKDAPTHAQLQRKRRRLGELLQSWQAVETGTLDKALKEQAQTQVPLGRILVSNGWLDEETLAEAIAYQANLPRAQLNAEQVLEHSGHVAPDFGTRYRAVYIGVDEQDHPLLAMASPLPEAAMDELQAWFGLRPLQHIVRESEISIALRLLSGSRGSFAALGKGTAGVPLLGDMLIEQGLLKRDVFDAAMKTYRPDRHGRVG